MSVDAAQDNETVEEEVPVTARFVGAVGATVSDVDPPLKVSGQVFCAAGPPQITVAK